MTIQICEKNSSRSRFSRRSTLAFDGVTRFLLGVVVVASFGLMTLNATVVLAAEVPLQLKKQDRILFLGSELTEQDIKHNFLEGAISTQFPDWNLSFRNLGWAGDDPTGVARGYFGGAEEGYRRLLEEIDRLQPTVIFVSYGENGSYSGVEGIADYLKNFTRLIEDLKKRTPRIVICSPTPAETLPAPAADVTSVNATREAMSGKLKELAAQHDLSFVDLYSPLKDRFSGKKPAVSYDTIRFNADGYALIADATLKGLGLKSLEDARPEATLQEMILRKNDLYFHRYRPQNETYLRGFRKHEQGQNAKEISEFDPLIQRAEERIAAFLQAKPLPPEIELPEPAPLAFKPLTPEAQRDTFKLADGLEIELFAAEPLVANPIHMNFDSRGRLWIASSPIYPQLRPGAVPNDSIVILEDTDNDGRADKKTVFAEGLLIPTAILPDEKGGAYVANSTELLYLADEDGDGKADSRHVLLSGFGTEDTHHILHTFRWTPDVLLSLNQSIYIHSHLETPYGVERMLGSGIWRYRQGTARADQVMFGLVNPWGLIFDKWGQSFATDGAGGEGINYAFPGSAYVSAVGYNRILRGMNPGQPKHCGLEILTGRHFPENWQDVLVTADFRGNRINSFQLSPEGSGYVSKQLPDLLSCSDRAFRPVDLKQGPDGTLYIADWHDSIINHGEVDFRDPRRDDRHGRIWRVVAKGNSRLQPPQLEGASIAELLKLLLVPEQWTRQMARVQLTLRPQAEVVTALNDWIKNLDAQHPGYEQHRLEALWALQSINQISPDLLNAVLSSPDSRARAAGIRALSQSTEEAFGLAGSIDVMAALEKAVVDSNAQVRLEAVNALRATGKPRAAEIALRALDQDADQYIDYALYLTVRELKDDLLSRLEKGECEFQGDLKKTLFALKAIDNPSTVAPLMALLSTDKIPQDRLADVLATIGKFVGPKDAAILFERALAKPDERTALLGTLVTAAQKRNVIPEGQLPALDQLLGDTAGLRLVGLWKQKQFQDKLITIVEDAKQATPLRHAAIDGLQGLNDQATLERFASDPKLAMPFRRLAVIALISLKPEVAAQKAVALFKEATEQQQPEVNLVLDAFLSAKDGPEQLAAALKDQKIPELQATLGIRKADSAGARAAVLVTALRTAGGLSSINKSLTAEELAALIAQVEKSGNPKQGEEIYRRKDLACITCHSLGGAGGLVGPDMLSLGASSPVDYIIQSLLEPSAKIKEGYHTVSVATVQGRVYNGVMVREGSDDLVLRDAQNREVSIPKGDIDERNNSPTSMMPADLTAKLPRDEFVDLVAFLSSLGKEGPYKVPQNRFVRRWLTKDGNEVISRVDGKIPVEALLPSRSASFTINVTTAGKIGIQPNHVGGLYLIRENEDQNLLADKPVTVLDLPVGKHTFVLSAFVHRRDPISIEIVDVEGSQGRAEVVNR